MKQNDYLRYLQTNEGFGDRQAADRADQAYSLARHVQRLASGKDRGRIPLDDVVAAWPGVMEMMPSEALALLDQAMGTVMSRAKVTRHALRNLELIADAVPPEKVDALFAIMLGNGSGSERQSAAAHQMAAQFPKLTRHFAGRVQDLNDIWTFLDEWNDGPMAAAYVPRRTLPAQLDTNAIDRQVDGEIRSIDVVRAHPHVDPAVGECSDAERWHEQTMLLPDSRSHGRTAVIHSRDGTPLGAVKWEFYKSMVALTTVRHSNGTQPLTRGMLYKVPTEIQMRVQGAAVQGHPFVPIIVDELTVAPVRFLGENDSAVALGWGHYRALLAKAIEDNPSLRRQ